MNILNENYIDHKISNSTNPTYQAGLDEKKIKSIKENLVSGLVANIINQLYEAQSYEIQLDDSEMANIILNLDIEYLDYLNPQFIKNLKFWIFENLDNNIIYKEFDEIYNFIYKKLVSNKLIKNHLL